ncbi:dihydrofolate reductase [Nonlabens tegetincola]|uniref:dihydrofolate reductase n=1 Tax=Nonlabens tegetincola TaxID=323273 RepID=UPI0029373EF7|nr:dihydrofolate reductase [Nonlabens tegetincola]
MSIKIQLIMFGFKKKHVPEIDPLQKELIENAQRRIKEKRGLFTHFVVFLVGAIGLIIISQVLMQSEPIKFLGVEWWIWVLFVWLLLLIYHAFKVFITNRLLGPEWEKKQYNRLVQKQQERIAQLESKINSEKPLPKTKIISQPANNKTLTMIAAAGSNNELGKDGDLVWHLPDDFKRFKAITTGHHIIMGRKTFESFPKPLPNRTHIVLTRDKNYKTSQAIVVHDMETALAAASEDEKPFIIGGGEIYQLALPYATHIELTRVHGSFTADAFFPEIDTNEWNLINKEHHPKDDKHDYAFDFETWKRK